MRKTIDAEKMLEFLKEHRDKFEDDFCKMQNLQALGRFQAYRDAYDYAHKLATESSD